MISKRSRLKESQFFVIVLYSFEADVWVATLFLNHMREY